MDRLLDRILHKQAMKRWQAAANGSKSADLTELRSQRNRARALRRNLDELIQVADGRLARPRLGSNHFPRPHGTEWAWRPNLWRGPIRKPGLSSAAKREQIGDDVALFHDCPLSEITLRQLRNTNEEDFAPFGVCLEVFEFQGSFLALAIDLPPEAMQGLTRAHMIRMDMIVEAERPVGIIARLNVQHGPNTGQVSQELTTETRAASAEFDLAYSDMNEKRVEKIWLDLIIQNPEWNQIVLRDLTLCRHHRADL